MHIRVSNLSLDWWLGQAMGQVAKTLWLASKSFKYCGFLWDFSPEPSLRLVGGLEDVTICNLLPTVVYWQNKITFEVITWTVKYGEYETKKKQLKCGWPQGKNPLVKAEKPLAIWNSPLKTVESISSAFRLKHLQMFDVFVAFPHLFGHLAIVYFDCIALGNHAIWNFQWRSMDTSMVFPKSSLPMATNLSAAPKEVTTLRWQICSKDGER